MKPHSSVAALAAAACLVAAGARAQGLRPGDRILGGAAALRGPAGTLADLSVERCGGTKAQLKIPGPAS